MKRIIFILLLLIFSTVFYSQQIGMGSIKGVVIDAETNQPVPYAVLEIMNRVKFRAARENGNYDIGKIQPGNYRLKISHINYEDNLMDISVFAGETTKYNIYLYPRVHEISQVVVKSQHISSKLNDLYEYSHTLQGKELQKDLGSTLAATLKNEPGISIRSMGPAPARPVMRGLSGDRITINEDGIKSSDLSATSPDHAVSLEPFTIERVEVLKGPKVLTKSPTSIGGVVNVVKNEISGKLEEYMLGAIGLSGESVSKSLTGSFSAEIPFDPFSAKIEISKRNTGNLYTPVGELENSEMKNINYSMGGSYFFTNGFIGASIRNFEMEYGIPGGFVGAHPNGVDIEMKKKQYNLKSRFYLDKERKEHFDFNLSRIYYRHFEYESSGLIGAEFKIIDYLGNLDFDYRRLGVFENGLAGISFQYRNFDIGGFVFTPQSKSLNLAAYIFETMSLSKFNFEMGARINYDKITPDQEEPDAAIGNIREKDFLTFSLSFSALYELTKSVNLGFNINKSSRVPTIEELFSEGPHLAAYSYEVGNPELKDESGLGVEIFGYYKSESIYLMLNFFYNRMNSFIIPRNTGRINYTQLLPIYASQSVDAVLLGFEAELNWKITDNIELLVVSDMSKGSFASSWEPLPQIPPLRGNVELKYFEDNYSAGATVDFAGRQNDVDIFENPTDGYILLGLFGQYSFYSSNLNHNINIIVDNLLNTEYRNHLSRVKSIMPEAGLNVGFTYKLFFHI